MSEYTPLNAGQALEQIEQHALYALKNSVYGGFRATHLVAPQQVVQATTKSAQWRRAEHSVTFTHHETDEPYEGHGIVGVGFDLVVPKEFKTDSIPAHQLRFRIGMTAVDSPIRQRRFLPTPDWRKQWSSSVPAQAMLVANHNRVDSSTVEQDPAGDDLRLPFSIGYSENGQALRPLDLTALRDSEASLPELIALHSYVTFAKPKPASIIRDPKKR